MKDKNLNTALKEVNMQLNDASRPLKEMNQVAIKFIDSSMGHFEGLSSKFDAFYSTRLKTIDICIDILKFFVSLVGSLIVASIGVYSKTTLISFNLKPLVYVEAVLTTALIIVLMRRSKIADSNVESQIKFIDKHIELMERLQEQFLVTFAFEIDEYKGKIHNLKD